MRFYISNTTRRNIAAIIGILIPTVFSGLVYSTFTYIDPETLKNIFFGIVIVIITAIVLTTSCVATMKYARDRGFYRDRRDDPHIDDDRRDDPHIDDWVP